MDGFVVQRLVVGSVRIHGVIVGRTSGLVDIGNIEETVLGYFV
jgi:hypothetical protein